MHSPGPARGASFARRPDVIAAVIMLVVLVSLTVAGLVLHSHYATSTPTAAEAGASGEHVLGGAPPSRAASPAPSARPSSASRLIPASRAPTQPAPPPVTYDGTGPSPSGAVANSASSLSWTDTVSGGDTALLVAVAVGQQDDSGLSASATDNGNALQMLATVQDNGQPDGFLEVFGLAGVPDGTNTIRVTVTGGPATELTGGSEAFDGIPPAGAFSTPSVAAGDGTTPVVTLATRRGGLVAAFVACGSAITGTTAPATQRFLADDNDDTGAGNSAGATSAAPGGDATVGWSSLDDWWGAIAIQVNS
jgi:hypothetical protein